MNYSSLQQHIADLMGRKDLDAQIPLFIENAEASMNRQLRVRDMVCPATVTAVGQYLYIPVDYLAVRSLRIAGGQPLSQVSPDIMQQKKVAGCTGNPSFFCELGNRIEIYPQAAPEEDGGTSMEVVFYKRTPALTDDHPSNWLLAAHPDAYITGAMSQYALLYVRNNDQFPDWIGMHDAIISQIKSADKLDRWSGGGMSVRRIA